MALNLLSKRMESPFLHMKVLAAFFLLSFFTLHLVANAIETPQYTVLRSGPDYEIRLHKSITWMSAPVQGSNLLPKSHQRWFSQASGFINTLMEQTQFFPDCNNRAGSNKFRSRALLPSPQQGSAAYSVKLFLHDQGTLPLPNPELNLKLDKWRARCVAVRKFPGFAKDDNINQEARALEKTLNEHSSGDAIVLKDKSSFAIAQYNDSIHLSERLNEVWMDVSGLKAEGCLSI